jgi:RHH-type proline utilization regulon transcriptional repressor/proline dehydrogenase/delta 1-pyrroline-5-carboxylate dehydrogenase
MDSLQSEIEAKGREIFARMRGEAPKTFSPGNITGRLLDWSMHNEALKVQLFRFVDVLPALNSSAEIARHARDYFGNGSGLPAPVRWAIRMSPQFPWLTAFAARASVAQMAKTFILARNGKEASPALRRMRKNGIAFTADLLGETAVSELEAQAYSERYLSLIESLADDAQDWPRLDQIDSDDRGEIPKVNVSVKISALYSQIHPADPAGAIAHLAERLRPLLLRANERQVFINFDMESTALKDLTLDLFKKLLDEPALRGFHHAGIALQAYLRDSERDLEDLIQWAKERNRRITVRLIKGAYWDYERIMAQQRGWPVPVFENKAETDANYERLARRMLENAPQISSAFGTHSVRSIASCLVRADKLGLSPASYEIQMLYGMAEPIKLALAKMGCRVRNYCPIGEILPGMSYLVRRLLENTSNESFLRAAFSEHISPGQLLRDPAESVEARASRRELKQNKGMTALSMNRTPSSHPSPPVGEKVPGGRLRGIPSVHGPNALHKELGTSHEPTPSPLPGGEPATGAANEAPLLGGAGGGFMAGEQFILEQGALHEPPRSADNHVRANTLRRTRGLGGPRSDDAAVLPFHNEPLTDFTSSKSRDQMSSALAAARTQLGAEHPLVIGGQNIWTNEEILSINPARPSEIVGRVAKAGRPEAESALAAARRAFLTWSKTKAGERAFLLERTAALMRQERFQLAALEVFETGKNWIESDADVAEAIDFCNFYAQEMRRITSCRSIVPGETSIHHYVPRGAGVIIAPWNFPLAILCGMTAAAVVAGNCVIIKPSEQSSVIGARFMDLLQRAGTPPGVVNFLPGSGEDVGAFLVEHSQIDFIAFTGSREVGLKIYEAAGKTQPGQANLKKAVCEMGGKNAIIVDNDADLDEAIPGIVYSAFGYQGQKCSALSRLIVLKENYGRVIGRLIEASRSLAVGLPEDPGTMIGPVIDDASRQHVNRYIELGKQEAELVFQGSIPESEGFFVPPAIFSNVPAKARIAQEEIFGPVLCVLRARNLDEALAWANDSQYALTGGFYSRHPGNIERVKAELQVGNLYINRSITGALVSRHPFGGFKMSGTGTKAGGRDYLQHFLFPRVVTENDMRRGFAPEQSPSIE